MVSSWVVWLCCLWQSVECLHFQARAIALWHTDASVKEEIAHTACLTRPFSGRVRAASACGTRHRRDALQVVMLGWPVWRISEILALVVPTCGDPDLA